ncbi:uncharacterized protein BDW47DRAFT_93390 [Aspergillus candidus]|uniref:BZIP domain-containing protein n=1 Tax=Aspergillus candidus TaxID=41067 RepID=A0A2I2FHY4_ASPCN|nr:hypothetical protein BDW47DRAFT_93390 [Aspergillus candidus]PLB40233.1 hypothetical protein BDW47DRAFT_93390 [Aspergillus candidus]
MENNQHSPNSLRPTFAADIPRRSSQAMSGSERRRSANLSLSSSAGNGYGDDPNLPPGLGSHGLRTSSPSSIAGSPIVATGDPHHQRAPSLGELHQELEQEQEAQVNRLLQMIRSQQSQLQNLQQQQPGTAVVDDSSFPPFAPPPAHRTSVHQPSSLSGRRSSRHSSQAASPNLRPMRRGSDVPEGPGLGAAAAAGDSPVRRGSRDDGAFYQAEAAMLTRENQLLRQRIRELERQVSDLNPARSEVPAATGETTEKT